MTAHEIEVLYKDIAKQLGLTPQEVFDAMAQPIVLNKTQQGE